MKIKILFLAAVALLMLLPGASTASAACSGTPVVLSNNNFALAGSVTVTLCVVNNLNGTWTISVTSVSSTDPTTGAFKFFNQFFAGNGTSQTQPSLFDSGTPGTWTDKGCAPGCNADGFGNFATAGIGGSMSSTPTDYSWTVTDTGMPTDFALHIAFANCTGFVSTRADNGTPDTPGQTAPCASV